MHMGKQTFLGLTVAVALSAAAVGVVAAQTGDDPPPVDAPLTEEHEGRGRHAPRIAAGIVDILGVTPEEFGEQLRAGATPAEIAAGVGVDPATLSTALLANVSAHLTDAVAEGRIDRTAPPPSWRAPPSDSKRSSRKDRASARCGRTGPADRSTAGVVTASLSPRRLAWTRQSSAMDCKAVNPWPRSPRRMDRPRRP